MGCFFVRAGVRVVVWRLYVSFALRDVAVGGISEFCEAFKLSIV